uniref:Uncharacterized protein n=1 Tax=Strongyloides papillosus TaxID=174720 RepID=A0A0N5BI23_STREA
MIYGIRILLRSTDVLVRKVQIEYLDEVKRDDKNKTQVVVHRARCIELRGEIHEVEHIKVFDNNKPNIIRNLFPPDPSSNEKKSSICNENVFDNFGNHGSRMNNSMDEYCELIPRENIYNRRRLEVYWYFALNIIFKKFPKWSRCNLCINGRCYIKKTIRISFGTSLFLVFGLLGYMEFEFMIQFIKERFICRF